MGVRKGGNPFRRAGRGHQGGKGIDWDTGDPGVEYAGDGETSTASPPEVLRDAVYPRSGPRALKADRLAVHIGSVTPPRGTPYRHWFAFIFGLVIIFGLALVGWRAVVWLIALVHGLAQSS